MVGLTGGSCIVRDECDVFTEGTEVRKGFENVGCTRGKGGNEKEGNSQSLAMKVKGISLGVSPSGSEG